jgi:hypothetical protein
MGKTNKWNQAHFNMICFTSLSTLSFTHRTTMEGHAIHSESCFHIQQDEEYVRLDNRMWQTVN